MPAHILVDRASAAQYSTILDPIVALTHAAARHPHLRIGTAVLVVPIRNEVVLATELATLDHVSGGWRTGAIERLAAAM